MRYLNETLQTPIAGEYDVIVCGGGPAGIGAGVSAARLGLRTLLVERYGFLGGAWTANLVTPLFDGANKGGISGELCDMLRAQGLIGGLYDASCDLEYLKVLLDDLCLEAGVQLLFHTQVVNTVRDGDKVTGIVVENKSGRQAFLGKIIIDCTGDGDVAALAGVPFQIGDEPHHTTQAMTTMLKLCNVDFVQREPYELLELMKEGQKKAPDYKIVFDCPWIIDCPDGSSILQYVHVRGRTGTDAQDLTRAELEGRKQGLEAFKFLKENVRGFERAVLAQIASHIGVRETRRIKGEYCLTEEDLRGGKTFEFPDATFICEFNIDIHEEDSEKQTVELIPAYTIPYRCLVPLGVDNLLVAGRCISGTRIAMASYRVTGICLAMGQVAGTAALLALEGGITPREVSYSQLREKLAAQNVILAGRENLS